MNNKFLTLALSGVALLCLSVGARADVTLIGTGQDVQVIFGYEGDSSNDVLSNNITSDTFSTANMSGDSIDLGTIAAGQAIIFSLYNTSSGQTFTSFPAGDNPDQMEHAEFLPLDLTADQSVQDQESAAIKALTENAHLAKAESNAVLALASGNAPDYVLGFWDNTTLSPFYGDSILVITGATLGPVPEPGSVFCFSVGVAGLAAALRFGRRAA